MDKNTVTGVILIVIIMLVFGWFNAKNANKYNKAQRAKQDSIAQVQKQKELEAQQNTSNINGQIIADTLAVQQDTTKHELTPIEIAAKAEEQFYTMENDLMKVTFTNIGGRVYSVELKNQKTYEQQPLILFNGDKNEFGLSFFANQQISTAKLGFKPTIPQTQITMSPTDTLIQLPMRLTLNDGGYIEYVYSMKPKKYIVDLQVNVVGLKNYINPKETNLNISWTMDSPQQEQDFKDENSYTYLAYKYPNTTDIEKLSGTNETDSKNETTIVNWIAFKQKFFSAILINKNNFISAQLNSASYKPNNAERLIKHFAVKAQMPYDNTMDSQTYPLSFYFGINHYNTLRSYDQSFEKLVPIGSIVVDGWVNRFIIIPVFNFFEKFISSYGIIILILTLLIKIVLYPLTRKSYISMAKMRLLKPEIDKIAAKYPKKEDAMKKQQETMALYRRTGTSMMGGCLPMLLQMPILFAMFRFFPASFELRQQGFLWAKDLSAYDSILKLPFNIPFYGDHVSLFALLMAISVFLYSKVNMKNQSTSQQNSMPGMKYMMLYMTPIMLLCFGNQYSSGLSYYYLLFNVLSMAQMWLIQKYVVKDEVLLRQMNEKAKQPVKKSKWQQKLEEMQRQQQAQQRKRK